MVLVAISPNGATGTCEERQDGSSRHDGGTPPGVGAKKFIVEAVNRTTRADVQLVIEAASEEAARVKAELASPDMIVARVVRLSAGDTGQSILAAPVDPNITDGRGLGGLRDAILVFGILKFIVTLVAAGIIVSETNR